MDVDVELLIQHGEKVFIPIVQEDIQWTTERKGSPGKLTFKVMKDKHISFAEGDPVRLKVNGKNVFYGFVFKKQRDREQIISVTAYDQLRYFKNKDTYVYENKTAGEVIKMICGDFRMQTGTIQDTGFKIASRVEDNQTLFDIIQNALDLTLQNQKKMYVLFDDFGKVSLKSIDKMQVNIVIDEDTGENFDYSSTIDEQTYNKIKLVFDNEKTGQRDVYIAQDSSKMNQWGVLQYYDKLEKGENGQSKANALLDLYNKKTRKLTIKNALGDVGVRAGSLVVVMLALGDMTTNNLMLVESCKHTFRLGEHWMELKLRGGDFV